MGGSSLLKSFTENKIIADVSTVVSSSRLESFLMLLADNALFVDAARNTSLSLHYIFFLGVGLLLLL